MNELEKFLRKISLKDRSKIKKLISSLISGDDKIKALKIKNTDFYRARLGKFRIIFHKEKNEIIIDSVRFRNESTYKNVN